MAETLFGTYELSLYTMSLIAGAVIVCLALVYWFLRRRGNMAFMRGGANRQPRLAVLDAAAVDARRRLVLVRRDDVEHLILIGGPSDLVVESGIGRATAVAQPEKAKAPAARAPARSSKPATAAQPARQPAKPNGEPQREAAQTPPRTEARPEPAKPVRAEPVTAPRPSAEPVAEPKRPPEPVAVRPAVSTAAAAAAVVPNGNVRTEAKPERDLGHFQK